MVNFDHQNNPQSYPQVCVSLSIFEPVDGGGKRVNWRQRVITDWPNDPQRAHKAREALKQIEDGLLQLASLGHPLHLEEGYTPPPPPEWPKVMFHIYQGSKVFNCEADLTEAGEDWYPTMDEARHAAGVTKQNQRGGIFSKALPAIMPWFTQESIDQKALNAEANKVALAAKKQFIADMRAQHRAKVENGLVKNMPEEKRNAREI
jgi:hypothetical protein